MASGTDGGLLDDAKPASVYKHGVLDQYMIRYATMTASTLTPRRCVLVDGFAGRGRYPNGKPASAEHMMLAAQKAKATTQIDIFLVEKRRKDFVVLDAVADEYRGRGLHIDTRHGDVGDYLGEVAALARGASLFTFLDPCGANLSWDTLTPVLRGRGKFPRTEALLNFSADLTRRAGGQLLAGQFDLGGVAALDRVCGGEWWRAVAVNAYDACGRVTWETAADAVALEYARHLGAATGMRWAVAPIRRQAHHQPVYHLVFLTHGAHGFWVMGDAASVARERWLESLGPDDEELEGMLFDTVQDQILREHARAVKEIRQNIVDLVSDGTPKVVVDHTVRIFGDVYGEARVTSFNQALRELVKEQQVEFVKKGSKPHQHVIQRARAGS